MRHPAAAAVALAALLASCGDGASPEASAPAEATTTAADDPCDEAHSLLDDSLAAIDGDTHQDRLATIRESPSGAGHAARRAGLVIDEAEDCFSVEERVDVAELAQAASVSVPSTPSPSPTPSPTQPPSPEAEPPPQEPPPPAEPQGELVLVDWGSQSGGGSSGGIACTSIEFTFRNASDTPVQAVTIALNTTWGWKQSADESDDGVARTFFEDGTRITDTRTLGLAPYDEVTFRWEICTPDQYDEVYPEWRGEPFGFSGKPSLVDWTWAS